MRILAIAVALLVPLSGALADEIKWVGCDISLESFVGAVSKAFEEKTGHKIKTEDGGATRGIRDVVKGTAQVGGTCRPCCNLPEEQGVVLIPVAWDALVVMVHPSNSVQDITLEQIRKVFLGELTNWKELGGNDAPIDLFYRKGKLSGVGAGFRQLVFQNPEQDFTPNAKIFDSSRPLEEAVEKSPNAIGVSGISSARTRAVKLLKIEGKDPTRENVVSGQYLLYRPLYLTVPKKPDPLVSEFVKFTLSAEGQAVIRTTGTVTLEEGKHLWEKYKEQRRPKPAK